MLDIALIRRDPDRVRRSALRRGGDPSFVDELLRLEAEYRRALTDIETSKAEKNALSARIGRAADKVTAATELRPQLAVLSAKIAAAQIAVATLSPDSGETRLRELLTQAANVLDDGVPEGHDESANVCVRAWGTPREFAFAPKPHWELGERLGIIDFERAAKLSGSRFNVLLGAGARLSRALVSYFLDRNAQRGYTEVVPPFLVTRETMWSTGQLTKFSDAMFTDRDADLFLIPTAEVPLAALHSNEILPADSLPRMYTAYSPCFRKEAGAAGKDTRGLIRQHQFEKVEMVWVTDAQSSWNSLETMTGHAEALLRELGLAHRTMLLCAGDTGFAAAKTYDIEVWIPSESKFREVSSCSNDTDFQARRAGIRYRRDAKAKPELAHTINGSGLPVGRTLVAILENYQREDGTIDVPAVLQPYMGCERLHLPA
ncbi:MAG: serine--tRNA ligase [Candidatus Eremiobacteraeota bacterium]|nr:serine--tRNA ligase [Candidatus Eremiobacteraeota bacterium]